MSRKHIKINKKIFIPFISLLFFATCTTVIVATNFVRPFSKAEDETLEEPIEYTESAIYEEVAIDEETTLNTDTISDEESVVVDEEATVYDEEAISEETAVTEETVEEDGKNVIYVNYTSGKDSNDGLTSDTPVKTLSKAYGFLSSDETAENNIIVIIGDYKTGAPITCSKPATILGKYNETDFSGNIWLRGDSNGVEPLSLNAETIFRDITLSSSSGTFIYCHGNNLTMDTGVVTYSSGKPSSSWGLVSTNMPSFTVVRWMV